MFLYFIIDLTCLKNKYNKSSCALKKKKVLKSVTNKIKKKKKPKKKF